MKITESKIIDILNENRCCILATAAKNSKPESSVMSWTYITDKLYMSTEAATRKISNIRVNPNVSIVFWKTDGSVELQLEGTAKIIANSEVPALINKCLAINPALETHINSKSLIWFEIEPTWYRYSDFAKQPPEIIDSHV